MDSCDIKDGTHGSGKYSSSQYANHDYFHFSEINYHHGFDFSKEKKHKEYAGKFEFVSFTAGDLEIMFLHLLRYLGEKFLICHAKLAISLYAFKNFPHPFYATPIRILLASC